MVQAVSVINLQRNKVGFSELFIEENIHGRHKRFPCLRPNASIFRTQSFLLCKISKVINENRVIGDLNLSYFFDKTIKFYQQK